MAIYTTTKKDNATPKQVTLASLMIEAEVAEAADGIMALPRSGSTPVPDDRQVWVLHSG
jgi:hypothetical protein